MNTLNKIAAALSLAAAAVLADGMTQIHPGYTLTDIMPTSNHFLVGGLSFYSNGDIAVCNWGNPGDVWVIKNPQSGDKNTLQPKRFAVGTQQVMGCTVVRDTLYVMQMGELTAVIDKDGDGVA